MKNYLSIFTVWSMLNAMAYATVPQLLAGCSGEESSPSGIALQQQALSEEPDGQPDAGGGSADEEPVAEEGSSPEQPLETEDGEEPCLECEIGPEACPEGYNIIEGTEADDTLYGTPGNDCILGYGGADTILGGSGNDFLSGGPGNDIISGGNGDDIIYGEDGDDLIIAVNSPPSGGSGCGPKNGEPGVGEGSDKGGQEAGSGAGGTPSEPSEEPEEPEEVCPSCDIRAEDCPEGYNIIEGTAGDDVLEGTPGSDCILGYEGEDNIVGGNGDDFLAGGPGDDTIDSGNGKDVVYGGDGNDRITEGNGKGSEIHGNAGNDVIDAGNGTDTLIFGEDGHDRITAGNGKDRAYGGDGNDFVTGGNGKDELWGEQCHDVLIGGQGADLADGGEGFDACDGENCEKKEKEVDECESDADCSAGHWCVTWVGLCIPWTPDGQDANGNNVCNGEDDDCDDLVDEDYEPTLTTCGIGACYAEGELICEDGEEIDTCIPGQPAPDDPTCDGIDDDCDGTNDEDYPQTPTACGIGACAATGLLICENGTETDTCTPGTPALDDATCNGIDDDCNGLTDEDYVPLVTTCGIGACSATGLTSCVNGQVLDSCTPGAPAPDDSLCNALDDDCDGVTDEDYPETPTSCVVSGCYSTGRFICVDGEEIDTCPIDPLCVSEAACGDGADNDGDGLTDCADTVDCALTPECQHIPPPPEDVAPPLEPGQPSRIYEIGSFLFQGSDPIQEDVLPGTIEPERIALLSGHAETRDGSPLPGVSVTVLGHPEFGSTHTRADGDFDMAINGGGIFTLTFDKEGYISVQRMVQALWEDSATAEKVVMIERDPEVTVVDFTETAASQVVSGSAVTDEDGTRQALLVIPPGTQAWYYRSDGSTVPLEQASLRITEFTVGPEGPDAMPLALPPTSAYTYAFEATADEALQDGIKLGGKDVLFSQPVPFYTDNFLGFPVGTGLPTGYVDEDAGSWKAVDNGLVIGIVSITAGLADIDIDGDSVAEDPAELADLGITEGEREILASLYEPSDSVWRVMLPHLSYWDVNMGFGFPPGSGPPGDEKPKNQAYWPESGERECTIPGAGSDVECQSRVLGESVPITGTPYSLHYRSDRVRGFSAGRTLYIPLKRPGFEDMRIEEVVLKVRPAGHEEITYPFLKDDTPEIFPWTWDGLDLANRVVRGRVAVHVTITYTYRCDYSEAARLGAYSYPDAVLQYGESRDACRLSRSRQFTEYVEHWPNEPSKLGGWSLSHRHELDFNREKPVVMYGDGQRGNGLLQDLKVESNSNQGTYVGVVSGVPLKDMRLYPTNSLAAAPDGSVFVKDSYYVQKIDTDKLVTTVASPGNCQPVPEDGAPAINGPLCRNTGWRIAVDPRNGQVILADHRSRIVRIDPVAGRVYPLAGILGSPGYNGDDILATSARLNMGAPALAVDRDGRIFFTDVSNYRIRMIDSSGIISTVAGTGTPAPYGNIPPGPAPAVESRIWALSMSIVPDDDGGFYFTHAKPESSTPPCCYLRHVDAAGVIKSVWMGISSRSTGDFSMARNSAGELYLGSLYIGKEIRKLVFTEGSPVPAVVRVLGNAEQEPSWDSTCVENIYPKAVGMVNALAFGPEDKLYATDTCYYWNGGPNARRRLISGGMAPGWAVSEDGRQLYEFDFNDPRRDGRHLATYDALTAGKLYEFEYDTDGLLVAIRDGDGSVTTIERDDEGSPMAIVAPSGQRTELQADDNGYLTAIRPDPDGPAHGFAYGAEGLMKAQMDPRGFLHKYVYDSLGRIERVANAENNISVLSTEQSQNFQRVTYTTPEGRVTKYETQDAIDGKRTTKVIFPDNTYNQSVLDSRMGKQSTTLADGTKIDQELTPDPIFGMQHPVTNSTTTTPSGLKMVQTATRTVTLSNQSNPLTLTSWNESTKVNGKTSSTVYDPPTRTFTEVTPEGRTTTTEIDDQGRTTSIQIPGFAPVSLDYDDHGRIVAIAEGEDGSTDQRVTTMAYYDLPDDPKNGYLQSISGPIPGDVTEYTPDAMGRVRVLERPDDEQILFDYDGKSNLTSLTPPGRPAHTFDYTAVDLMENYSAPDADGGTDVDVMSYQYFPDRDLQLVTLPTGETIEYDYTEDGVTDTDGKLNRMVTAEGDYVFSYYPPAQGGKLQSVIGPDYCSLSYTHDGTLPKTTTWGGTGCVQGSVSKTYDNDFRLDVLSVNGSPVADYGYNNDGILTSAGPMTLFRDPGNAKLTGTTLGGVTTNQTYDGFGALESYVAGDGASDVYSYQITSRDERGRILIKEESVMGEVHTYSYTYDLAGRLDTVTVDGALEADYEYDANGNRLGKWTPSETETGVYDDQDRMASYGDSTYTFDDAGFLTRKTDISTGDETVYDYDVLGNLRSVALPDGRLIEYEIDAAGRRVGKKVNGVVEKRWLYIGALNPVAELNENNELLSTFIYSSRPNVPDFIVSKKEDGVNWRTYRVVADHLGSVRLVIGIETGDVVQRVDYDEFGVVLFDSNPGWQPFGFAGGLYDRDTALVRFGARDYDSNTGRWTAKDPIFFDGGQVNLYGYVLSDPLNRLDIDGRIDIYGGVEGEAIFVFGSSGTAGGVWDVDDPQESGGYGSGGGGFGLNIGGGVCVGVVDELEGDARILDVNLGLIGFELIWDNEGISFSGFKGFSVSLGPGLGISYGAQRAK